MDNDVVLKVAEKTDEQFLYHVYASRRKDEVASWGFQSQDAAHFLQMQWKIRKQSYDMQFPNNETSIIYTSDDQPIGSCIIFSTTEYVRIVDLMILPQFQSQGFGSALITSIQMEASKLAIPLMLSVEQTNPALRLYQRLGFYITSESDFYYSMSWVAKHNFNEE
ncbi:GNAT family N-acetyltransferase [Paenibacillus sp. L3-i20]|uniref:GNAT family N-acetyltransferase n=1 Tax=Paenibacillus sp. L3-i20 TaxID=2905833 RepID=UPI001EE062BC|nr:GNAT family N-acetyltransferase [Paenibacillus sp. L3-i20]GKU78211.1 hypothetical protein L3i20_v226080 [Paenibacillus sp. L3-i20]